MINIRFVITKHIFTTRIIPLKRGIVYVYSLRAYIYIHNEYKYYVVTLLELISYK